MENNKLNDLKEEIDKLGERLVNCSKKCQGILEKDPERGIIPRCLFLDTEERTGEKGAIVVGINPGSSEKPKKGKNERYYYKSAWKENPTAKILWEKWKWAFQHEKTKGEMRSIKSHPYHKKIIDMLNLLDYKGPILWTELVKCECLEGKHFNDIPVQTKRECIHRFLKKEIETCPKNYTLFTVGNMAFEFCSLRFPERLVIGIPHPTGSYGHFPKLYNQIKEDKKKGQDAINKAFSGDVKEAIKLSECYNIKK